MSGGAPIQGRILFLHVFKKSRYQGFRGVHGKENALPFSTSDTVSDDVASAIDDALLWATRKTINLQLLTCSAEQEGYRVGLNEQDIRFCLA